MGFNDDHSWLDTVQIYINTLTHMFIAIIAAYTSWLCIQVGPTVMSWHTWLTTIGYQLLMAESIVSLYRHNSWTGHHARRTKNNLHWVLQAVGCAFAIAGMVVLYLDRDVHFVSLHSQLGLASGVFVVLGVLNGTLTLWARELRSCAKPLWVKLCHNCTGILAFALGMASLIYGFNLFPFRHRSPSLEVVVWMQAMCGVTIVFCLLGAAQSLWTQVGGVLGGCCRRDGDDNDDDGSSGFTNATADVGSKQRA